jgi:hypothetical protein
MKKESSSFFEKKEPKKLLLLDRRALSPWGAKVFCFFFSKKKFLLSFEGP